MLQLAADGSGIVQRVFQLQSTQVNFIGIENDGLIIEFIFYLRIFYF